MTEAAQRGVLGREELVRWLEEPDLRKRLVVTPMLDPWSSIGVSSIDVRLGGQFIVMSREAFPGLDMAAVETLESRLERYQKAVVRTRGESFVLHPGQLVIGSTMEYVQIPKGLMAYVIGKSSLGRMGLIIATATKVDPGFRGCITLEVINEGEVPLVLYPGSPIAQLVLHEVEGESVYQGRYECPTGPEFPRFSVEREDGFWWPKP